MTTIQEINNRIITKGNQLANDTKKAINDITLREKEISSLKQSKDVPSRPWLLAGSTCLAISVIGIISNDSKWLYYVGTLGVIALSVGFTKKHAGKSEIKSYSSNINIDEEKAFIIEQCNKILDKTKKDWDKFMDSLKSEIQNMIKTSSISEEKKDEYLSFTYYPETLSLSTLNLIDKFEIIFNDSDFASQIILEKTKFANEIALNISRTVNKQTEIYNRIKI